MQVRRDLANKSLDYTCPVCHSCNRTALNSSKPAALSAEDIEFSKKLTFKGVVNVL